jgi:glycosyltransferase involved in cell wall biosynthesis
MSNKLISCVISCYNEEKNIPILLDQIQKNNLEDRFEFIIVNNGSTDNSSKIIDQIKENFKSIIFINIIEDLGWGNGVITGLNIASCDYIGWTHGDLQYDLSILNEVYDLIKNPENHVQNLLIKGHRKKRSFSENFFTTIMSFIASIILCKKLYDINAQPNFFSRSILNLFKNTPKDLMLDLYLYYKTSSLKEKKILRLSVTQNKRIHGISSWKKNFFSNYVLSLRQLIGIIKIKLNN